MGRRVVIIGCGHAGAAAAEAAVRTDPNCYATLVERSRYPEYDRSALPYLVSGEILDQEQLILSDEEAFRKLGVTLLLRTQAVKIDVQNRVVTYRTDGGGETLAFDSLVLTVGASADPGAIPGVGKPGFYTMRSLEDALVLREAASSATSAFVYGAGPTGLMVADSLRRRGLKVFLADPGGNVLSGIMDSDLALGYREAARRRSGHVEFQDCYTVHKLKDRRSETNSFSRSTGFPHNVDRRRT